MLFQTADMLASGSFFWSRLQAFNQPPFNPAISPLTGICMSTTAAHALIVSNNDLDGDELRVCIMLRDVESEDAAVEAQLDANYRFVEGKVWGAPVDEVGAATHLQQYAGFFDGCRWEMYGPKGLDEDEEGVES